MEFDRDQLRTVMKYMYLKNIKATEAHKEMCGTLGENVVSYNTMKSWFHRFKNGEKDMSEKPRSGRPSVLDDEEALKDNF